MEILYITGGVVLFVLCMWAWAYLDLHHYLTRKNTRK
jgi:hypothetical protein